MCWINLIFQLFYFANTFNIVSANINADPASGVPQLLPFDPLGPFNPIKPPHLAPLSPIGDGLGVTFVINTTSGQVRGARRFSRLGYHFIDFRGIPYARPPVGKLRFEPTEPHPGWDYILDATLWSSSCIQAIHKNLVIGDEDCLTLNIAARDVPKDHRLLPVMVFIHGGLFMSGAANFYPPLYFMDEEVILVTMNYRLSAFGFLNTGDSTVTGNMGLKDQVMALKWIKDNIKNFHGDPDRILLFGESAGAACVHLHMLSKVSRKYFSKAIAQSGTALAPWALIQNPKTQSQEFASALGCTNSNTKDMIACLKKVTAGDIANVDKSSISRYAEGKYSLYGPTVEVGSPEPFLSKKPIEIIKSGDVAKVPFITGVNSAEGLVYMMAVMRNESFLKYVNENWKKIARYMFNLNEHHHPEKIIDSLTSYYMKDVPITRENLKDVAEFTTDGGFFLDSHDVALMHAKFAPTYIYYYTYHGIFSIADLLFTKLDIPLIGSDLNYMMGTGVSWVVANILNQRSDNKLGICHGDELALLFNLPLVRKEIRQGDPDFEFSKKFVLLWVSFAENGYSQLSKAGVDGLTWEPVNVTNPKFKDVSLTRLEMNDDFKLTREPFFERILRWKKLGVKYL